MKSRPKIGTRIVRGLTSLASRAEVFAHEQGTPLTADEHAAVEYIWRIVRWHRLMNTRRTL